MNRISGRPCLEIAAICVFQLGILVSAVGAAGSSSPLAADILADTRVRGAKAAVATLWSDNDRWNSVIANIGHGKPEWLEVAIALQAGTDGGAAETLDEAIFFALKPSPVAVLNLLREHHFQVELVCSSNIGTDYTPDKSRRYIRQRIDILEGLSDSKLSAIRDECLTGLRAALKDFPVTKKPSQIPARLCY
jgi:hypothetical protein